MILERLNEIRLITQNFDFFINLSSNFGKKFLSLSKKKQQKTGHHYLLFFQFTFINDQPNATFLALALNYVSVNVASIKSLPL